MSDIGWHLARQAWAELERAASEDTIIEAARQLKRLRDARYRTRLRLACLELAGGKCVKCGTTRRLEFHHRNPEEKVASISWLIRNRPGLLRAEVEKCDLLCYQCHKQHHYPEG